MVQDGASPAAASSPAGTAVLRFEWLNFVRHRTWTWIKVALKTSQDILKSRSTWRCLSCRILSSKSGVLRKARQKRSRFPTFASSEIRCDLALSSGSHVQVISSHSCPDGKLELL